MAARRTTGPARVAGRFPAVSERTARRSLVFTIVLGTAYLSGHLFAILAAAYIAWRIS
jgi:hypothetical protein